MTPESIIKQGKNKLKAIGLVQSSSFCCEEKNEPCEHLPGLGWCGAGVSYSRNINDFSNYYIVTKMINDNFIPDTSTFLFGEKISSPILAAPMSGIKSNLRDFLDEKIFLDAILGGCIDVGSLGCCGDSFNTTVKWPVIQAISKNKGIVVFKPRCFEEIKKRIELLIKKNVVAIGIDIDGMTKLLLESAEVSLKNKKELEEIRSLFLGPMFLKGVLSTQDVDIAYNLGFDAVVLSNHGGRSVDYCPSSLRVLPEIVESFKGKIKILVDGGIRNGYDAFIYMALGADAVLVGRTILYGVIGGGRFGVAAVISKLTSELSRSMLFTGCRNIEEITDTSVKHYKQP